MTIPILYLHGFASSPHGTKIGLLRQQLEPEGFVFHAPDLNAPSFEELDYDEMVRRAVDMGKRNPPRVMVGSSLGSLIALDTVRAGVRAPLVLIAPGLGVAEHWLERIPAGDPIEVLHHGQERELLIHRAFFEQMARVNVDREPPPTRVTVLMGSLDETVPFDRVEAVWRRWERSGKLVKGSRFVEIPNGDHSLTAFIDQIADEIRRQARS